MRTVLILFLTLLSAGTFAQTSQPTAHVQKIGYADWELFLVRCRNTSRLKVQ